MRLHSKVPPPKIRPKVQGKTANIPTKRTDPAIHAPNTGIAFYSKHIYIRTGTLEMVPALNYKWYVKDNFTRKPFQMRYK